MDIEAEVEFIHVHGAVIRLYSYDESERVPRSKRGRSRDQALSGNPSRVRGSATMRLQPRQLTVGGGMSAIRSRGGRAMEIRRYKRGEEGAVWSVYFAATHESNARDYHPDLIERWAPRDQDMVQWSARLARKNPFVATVGGEIVGMAEIEPDGFIDYFYVHPRYQRRGVGKALLARLEAEAATLQVKTIWADVSLTAKEFFMSRGFRITEAKSNVILGHPAPNFRMQKTLNSEPDGP